MCHTQRADRAWWLFDFAHSHTPHLHSPAGAHYNMDHTSFRVCARGRGRVKQSAAFFNRLVGRSGLLWHCGWSRDSNADEQEITLAGAVFTPARAQSSRGWFRWNFVRAHHRRVRPQIAPIIWGVLAPPKFVPDPTSAGTGDFTFYNWMNEWLRDRFSTRASCYGELLIGRSWILHFTRTFLPCKAAFGQFFEDKSARNKLN
jgi:hypothetical protein